MESQNLISDAYPLSLKRKEDLTVDELKRLPAFALYSDEDLAAILETVKRFTTILLPITRKEAKRQGMTKVIEITSHYKKKAA